MNQQQRQRPRRPDRVGALLRAAGAPASERQPRRPGAGRASGTQQPEPRTRLLVAAALSWPLVAGSCRPQPAPGALDVARPARGSLGGAAAPLGEGVPSSERLPIEPGALTLWYDEPAKAWTEALPVGNGRLGGMVYGKPAREVLPLNESTFWSGGPSRNDNPRALSALGAVRQHLFAGEYAAAEALINQNMTAAQLHGSMYQPVGNLRLSFPGHEQPASYHRELDLRTAIATTRYEVAGVTYVREIFASLPDQVLVVRLSASEPESLSFSVALDGPLQASSRALSEDSLQSTGTSSTHEGVPGQVRFDARARVQSRGGATRADGARITVSRADEAVILISIATNFVDYRSLAANESERALRYLSAAQAKPYSALRAAHVAAYREYFDRVAIQLGSSPPQLPTDERLRALASRPDPELVALYYQFGRYLLISSSQPGGQPATLQGIWNDQVSPPWDSKYTLNINAEMNYWPAEKTGLSELHEPLLRLTRELSVAGRQTARAMYGADGWVAHHNTDIWRISGVVDGAFWGMWPMGGAWLAQHLWEHYLYTGDRAFLADAYPVLRSACEFYLGFLIEEPGRGALVVSPSVSPENAPPGRATSVTYGTTMDTQLLFDLFSKTIEAASLLGRDPELIDRLRSTLRRLPAMRIGRHGQLQEWLEDLDDPSDHHRHVSHLYGLFPSNQITADGSPALLSAARTSLLSRGDVSTGWSMGWKVNLWARLLDGNHALRLIRDQLHLVEPGESGGGTYPNLFDAHPPFQIDGNFGCTSGITEMLLQAHAGAIHLLPALPDEWASSGGIAGVHTPGGFEVELTWEKGEVEQLLVRSSLGGNARIRAPNALRSEGEAALRAAAGDNPNPFFRRPVVKPPQVAAGVRPAAVPIPHTWLYDLRTEAGGVYRLAAAR